MKKTILSITPTSIHHPAIGILYQIIFSDYTTSLVYEETFLHQIEDYSGRHLSLIGKEIDVEKAFIA